MANEQRLIYANTPLKQLSDYMEKLHCSDDYRDGLYRGMEIAESYINNAPTVDAVEVVHGRWIQQGELDEDGNGQYHCSVCSAGEKHNPIVDVPYCWKCGAKMDGGNEDV